MATPRANFDHCIESDRAVHISTAISIPYTLPLVGILIYLFATYCVSRPATLNTPWPKKLNSNFKVFQAVFTNLSSTTFKTSPMPR